MTHTATIPARVHTVPPACHAPGCHRPGEYRLVLGTVVVGRWCAIHTRAGVRHALLELDHGADHAR
ncbi:MAG: hypothetical protein IPM45_04975 [Acidimicrobiales bacterium]|nr:hypothetical protein [Acidimicrobiales bacterium]